MSPARHTPFAASVLGGWTEPIVLASASPRRRELLEQLGVALEVVAPEVDESPLAGESARAQATRLALAKVDAVASLRPGRLIVAADTVVSSLEGPLGKPADRDDARRMLRLLSGRTHEVVTAVAVRCAPPPRPPSLGDETTRVTFRAIAEVELEAYLATTEPYDKAGAYGAQGQGAAFIERVDGCYFNVVGLPIVCLLGVVRACAYH